MFNDRLETVKRRPDTLTEIVLGVVLFLLKERQETNILNLYKE